MSKVNNTNTEKVDHFINKVAEKALPKRSSVTSLHKFMGYKKGLSDGINLMKGWARYYEENKFKTFVLNKKTDDDLLDDFLSTLTISNS